MFGSQQNVISPDVQNSEILTVHPHHLVSLCSDDDGSRLVSPLVVFFFTSFEILWLERFPSKTKIFEIPNWDDIHHCDVTLSSHIFKASFFSFFKHSLMGFWARSHRNPWVASGLALRSIHTPPTSQQESQINTMQPQVKLYLPWSRKMFQPFFCKKTSHLTSPISQNFIPKLPKRPKKCLVLQNPRGWQVTKRFRSSEILPALFQRKNNKRS